MIVALDISYRLVTELLVWNHLFETFVLELKKAF